MQLTMRLGAAIFIAALSACSSEDNYADNADSNAAYTTNETVLPADDAGADTLGNQMNQLNESGSTVDTGNSENTTTNGY